MQGERPSALLTFLIADVRGYTRYTRERGDEQAASVAARFAELARRGITEQGGELLELRGDEALGVFGSARDAMRAALELQRLFRTGADGQPALPLGVGIGIDAGEAVPVEGGYRGGALNLAARLCGQAVAGEILASETVVSLAGQVDGIRFEPRAPKRLKGLDEPVKIIEVTPTSPLFPLPAVRMALLRRFRRKHVTRRTLAAFAIAALAAGVAAGAALVVSARPGAPSAPAATRVALAIPRPQAASDDVLAPYREGLVRADQLYGVDSETLEVDDSAPQLSDDVQTSLDDFDLVLVAGEPVHRLFLRQVALHPSTRFMFLDPHLPDSEIAKLKKLRNYSDIFFNEGPAAYLAGALGALMAKREATGNRRPVVSIVAGDKDINTNQVSGFWAGAMNTVPGVVILLNYSHDFVDSSVCEAIANREIDKGSRVVFAAAGECSLGALSAAAVRGVWGVGSDVDRSYLGPHILASAVKRRDQAVDWTIRSFLGGTLPQGPLDVGIERNLVDVVGISPEVPSELRSKLARVKAQNMKRFASYATPLVQG